MGFSNSNGRLNIDCSFAAIAARIRDPRRRKRDARKGPEFIDSAKVGPNTWASFAVNDRYYAGPDASFGQESEIDETRIIVRLFRTDIVTLHADGLVEVTTNYDSMLTRGRVNSFLPQGWFMRSDRGVQYIEGPDGFCMPPCAKRPVMTGWETGDVREYLTALRMYPARSKEARHARYALALFYARRGWTAMQKHMCDVRSASFLVRGVAEKRDNDYADILSLPRRVLTPHYLRANWQGKWLVAEDGITFVRPMLGADWAFGEEEDPELAATYKIRGYDGKVYTVVDGAEHFKENYGKLEKVEAAE